MPCNPVRCRPPVEDELLIDSHLDLDQLLVNIEASLRVRKRSDFFSWVQGIFQAMIPHECLVCVISLGHEGSMQTDCLSSYPLTGAQTAQLTGVDDGLLHQLILRWERNGYRPVIVEPADAAEGGPPPGAQSLETLVDRLLLKNVVAHGLPGMGNYPVGFFAFFQIGPRAMPEHARRLQLLLPYLFAAFLRSSLERGFVGHEAAGTAAADVLTEREDEVLQWVKLGKSNSEIAQILGISPLTVKNHIQKILRKLNVQNRAQAVARRMGLPMEREPAHYTGGPVVR